MIFQGTLLDVSDINAENALNEKYEGFLSKGPTDPFPFLTFFKLPKLYR